ncbi:MobV family relaxase [Clostridium baratii]|uniref:Plasmid recombination-like protein n=1 Tax=Clostridium baratii TaxID=1561 RepID=A0A174VTB9_9CLOT|nr:MobV family relaxase [Clostridium baratii]CUQ35310.1 plasmid recombination-like protein [Clostridium baratii]
MEFAWNIQKNIMSDVKGLEKEQNREGYIRNDNIDLEKTHLNYDLVKSNLNLYQRVKKRVDEVRDISRIQKNSVVDCSNIITVPKEQSELWGIEKTKDYFKATYNYFCDEFGKENVISAKVHLDETAPHMHLHFVPINLENGKLQCKHVVTRNKLNKVHTEASNYLKNLGFDVIRGNGKTKEKGNIKDIHEFKKKKSKELEYKIDTLTERLNALLSVSNEIDTIKSIKTQKTLLGGKISLKENDYAKIISGYEKTLIDNTNLKNKNKNLSSENERLTKELNRAMRKIKSFDYGLLNFENKKEKLKEQLERQVKIKNRAEIDSLKLENENLKLNNKNLKSKVQDQEKELKIFYKENNIKSLEQKNNFFRKIKIKNLNLDR